MLSSKLPKNNSFLVEFAALIIIVITAPIWIPIAGVLLVWGAIAAGAVALLGAIGFCAVQDTYSKNIYQLKELDFIIIESITYSHSIVPGGLLV